MLRGLQDFQNHDRLVALVVPVAAQLFALADEHRLMSSRGLPTDLASHGVTHESAKGHTYEECADRAFVSHASVAGDGQQEAPRRHNGQTWTREMWPDDGLRLTKNHLGVDVVSASPDVMAHIDDGEQPGNEGQVSLKRPHFKPSPPPVSPLKYASTSVRP